MNKTTNWFLVGLMGLVLGGCVSGDRSLAQLKADGNMLFRQGHYDAALSKYDEYLVRKPDSVEVRQKIAETLRKLARPAEAQRYMRTVYDVEPMQLEHAVGLASTRVEAGAIASGLDFLRRYLDDHPTAEGYYKLAELAEKAGLPDDALRAYQVAVKLDGDDDPEPHRRLARFYQAHDLPTEATVQWRMVLWFDDADPEAGAALRALGHVPGPSFAVQPTD